MGLAVLFWGLILVLALPLAIFATLKIVGHIKARRGKSFLDEMLHQARRSEAAGEFVSAAFIYEKLKDFKKAAALYEKGGDFSRAAAAYETISEMTKAREMNEKAGDLRKAAETSTSMGDHIGAARIFSQLGDKISAAHAFEMSGNRFAAVRMYREVKDYANASRLLKEEGLLKESADMYRLSLAEDMQASNLDNYYTYACLLETAGEKDKSNDIFLNILSIDRHFMDVREKLKSLAPKDNGDVVAVSPVKAEPSGKDEEVSPEALIAGIPLRNIMSGRMEPRYSFRLWVHIARAFKKKYGEQTVMGNLSPESIFVDTKNNVTFDETVPKNFVYIAPETISGAGPDEISAIYSLGIILYEMLTGGLDTVMIKRPSEVTADVPSWLEDFTVKCIDKNRAGRYQSIDEIFSSLKALRNNM